jgi:hypothetical protein
MFCRGILSFETENGAVTDTIVKCRLALSRTDLEGQRQEFITSPPISTVSITCICPEFNSHAIVRTATPFTKRPEGIRVGDLLDTFDKMEAPSRKIMVSFIMTYASSNEIIINEEGPSEKAGGKRSADKMEGDDGEDGNNKKKAKGASTLSSRSWFDLVSKACRPIEVFDGSHTDKGFFGGREIDA